MTLANPQILRVKSDKEFTLFSGCDDEMRQNDIGSQEAAKFQLEELALKKKKEEEEPALGAAPVAQRFSARLWPRA